MVKKTLKKQLPFIWLFTFLCIQCAPDGTFERNSPIDVGRPDFVPIENAFKFKSSISGYTGTGVPSGFQKHFSEIVFSPENMKPELFEEGNLDIIVEPKSISINGNTFGWIKINEERHYYYSEILPGSLYITFEVKSHSSVGRSFFIITEFVDKLRVTNGQLQGNRSDRVLPQNSDVQIAVEILSNVDLCCDQYQTYPDIRLFASGTDTLSFYSPEVSKSDNNFLSIDSVNVDSHYVVRLNRDSLLKYLKIDAQNGWNPNAFVIDSFSLSIWPGEGGFWDMQKVDKYNFQITDPDQGNFLNYFVTPTIQDKVVMNLYTAESRIKFILSF